MSEEPRRCTRKVHQNGERCRKKLEATNRSYIYFYGEFGTAGCTIAEGTHLQFHGDEARILTSSAFRRLQGKTQVYPLRNNDFIRSQLTHSMEVAFVARAIARQLIWELLDVREQGYVSYIENIDVIINASCLIHDLGNPPFGHSGEDSIKKLFRESRLSILSELREVEELYFDFVRFDGNAQGFRMAVKTCGRRFSGGLRLRSPVLAFFVKYPIHSSSEFAKARENLDTLEPKKISLLRCSRMAVDLMKFLGIKENFKFIH